VTPTFRTERLLVRPVERADGPVLVPELNVFETARLLAQIPHPYGEADWDAFMGRVRGSDDHVWTIVADGAPVGCIGLVTLDTPRTARIGFWLVRAARGKGVVGEAVRPVLKFAFEDGGFDRIRAGHFDDNAPSAALQRRLGFVPVEYSNEFSAATGETRPHTDTVLTIERWRARRDQAAP
jgi:RimJ/RimL family protein N-acetyltransferase